MERIDTVIVGAGQAGLAMSRCLRDLGIEHVLLERGRVGERWRSERWDSLRLLTPNWQSRLPGFRYEGPDPDGFMTREDVVDLLARYAERSAAPILEQAPVLEVSARERGYHVLTEGRAFHADHVVLATGHCDRAHVPAFAGALAPSLLQVVPTEYRGPAALPDGGVLVVGASATGIQLAEEIHRSGRAVTLAVGRHTRMPRRYRGRDILFWLDTMGVLDERFDEARGRDASRDQPSMQLVGHPDHRTLDLATLAGLGVRLAGRALDGEDAHVRFADDLCDELCRADQRLDRLLARIDAFIATSGLDASFPGAFRPAPVPAADAPGCLDLRAEGIRTVVWATGFRRSYPWLRVPILDDRGELRHRGGLTPARGLYVMGLPFMRRRKSSFLDGVGDDARELARHLAERRGRAWAA